AGRDFHRGLERVRFGSRRRIRDRGRLHPGTWCRGLLHAGRAVPVRLIRRGSGQPGCRWSPVRRARPGSGVCCEWMRRREELRAGMATEREITAPVDLCRPDGRLEPAAVGWTRRPLHRGNLRGWGRRNRWEHWGIVSPEHIVGIVASTLDYAGVHGSCVLDRETCEETTRDGVVPFGRGAVLGECSGEGVNSVCGGGIEIELANDAAGTVIEARASGVRISVRAELP